MSYLFVVYQRGLDDHEESRAISRVLDFYGFSHQQDLEQRDIRAGDLGAFFVWKEHENIRSYRYTDDKGTHSFLTHFPFGYSKLINARPGDAQFAGQVGKLLLQDPSAIAHFAAPLGAVVSDGQSFIRVMTDGVGLSRIFYYRTKHGLFISNRAVAAILMAGEIPDASKRGWAAQTTFNYFPDSMTPFEGVSTLTHGEHITLRRGDEPRLGRVNALSRWLEGWDETVYDGFDRAIDETKAAISFDHVPVSLSGGRDSRTTASILTSHFGQCAKLRTGYPPTLEKDIAAQLVERLPYFSHFENDQREVAWSADRVVWAAEQRGSATAKTDLMDRARNLIRNYEGMALATHLHSDVALLPVVNSEGMPVFGGAGGELAKPFSMDERTKPTLHSQSDKRNSGRRADEEIPAQ